MGHRCLRYVCLFVCTLTLFSAADKDSGVKRCMLVRDEFLPFLVNFGSRGVTARHYFPDERPNTRRVRHIIRVHPLGGAVRIVGGGVA